MRRDTATPIISAVGIGPSWRLSVLAEGLSPKRIMLLDSIP